MDMRINHLNKPTCDCNARKCVLVVDDDPQTSQDQAEDLEDWGYIPIVAEGRGTKLLEDAKAKARIHRCRVALVDMRLFDAPGDESGLALAGQLAPTVCIIVTAYANIPATNRSRRYDNVVSFFEKGDDPRKLQGEVHNAFERFCPCSLRPDGPGYEELLRRTLKDSPDVGPDEICCALECLYRGEDPKIEKLHLTLPNDQYRSRTTAAVQARSGIYAAEPIRMDGRPSQREVVKVAAKKKIEDEVRNYSRYVKGPLPTDRCARIEDRGHSVTLWNIGAIRYTNIARDDRRLFSAWYAEKSSEDVKRALEDLFNETMKPWYREGSLADSRCVYDYYVEHMFSPDFERLIQEYPDQNETFDAAPLLGVSLVMRNPVRWAQKHRSQSSFRSRWQALTHGDLHSGNIFVDDYCRTYLLDYERSGPGYILRDFVELEADIRLQLTPIGEQFSLLYALDRALLAQKTGKDSLKPPRWERIHGADATMRRNLQKTFDAIVTLRRLARELTDELDSMDQYYWALLMETLISVVRRYAQVKDPRVVSAAKYRALLSAALVAERLASWGSEWPPRDWPRPEDLPEQPGPVIPVAPDVE